MVMGIMRRSADAGLKFKCADARSRFKALTPHKLSSCNSLNSLNSLSP